MIKYYKLHHDSLYDLIRYDRNPKYRTTNYIVYIFHRMIKPRHCVYYIVK